MGYTDLVSEIAYICSVKLEFLLISRPEKNGVKTPKNYVLGHFWEIVELNSVVLELFLKNLAW